MSLLDIRNLSVRFGAADAIPVVDGLDLSVDEGEVLAIVGESGSGKSVTSLTIMRLLAHPGRIVGGSILYRLRSGESVDLAQLLAKYTGQATSDAAAGSLPEASEQRPAQASGGENRF